MKKKKTPKPFTNIITLSDNFSNEDVCRRYMENILWGGVPVCPYCKGTKVYKFKDGKRYKCANNECYKKFTVIVGTCLENTKIPLRKWLHVFYIFSSHKKGISSHQLAKDIGVTQKTAWFMLSRMREILKDKAPQLMEGVTQVDECYVGGKITNFHKKKRMETIMKAKDNKVPVIGMVEKDGRAMLKPITEFNKETMQNIFNENLKKGATLVTDSVTLYRAFAKQYNHVYVNHAHAEYKKDGFHTNAVEGMFSHLKRGIYGIYHHASPKHLHRYCNEFAFRYNTRKCKEVERLDIALKQMVGRLKYKELIAKVSN